VSDPGRPDPDPGDDPFAKLPLFGDLARLLGQQGGLNWDAARQLALSVAAGGAASEPNVDPLERIRYQELGRIAELHLCDATPLATPGDPRLAVVPVNRAGWAHQALTDYRPLFERLARSLGRGMVEPDAMLDPALAADPFTSMFGGLMKMVAPMMLSMTAGSMVGHLAQHAMGTYHLPVPRPAGAPVHVVVPNVKAFAEEWSLDGDDLRLWVCLSELTHHLVLDQPHVRAQLGGLLDEYVDGFEADGTALEDKLASLDPSALGDPMGLQKLFNDPELLLGAVQSARQRAMLPRLEALVAVVVGYVDHVMDIVAGRLLGTGGRLSEAVRRNRVEASDSDRFVERLLGLELSQATYDRGAGFVDGVVERAGEEGLTRLWESERTLPTPAEVDAPGLWLARLEFD
jgi:putative hydrolase